MAHISCSPLPRHPATCSRDLPSLACSLSGLVPRMQAPMAVTLDAVLSEDKSSCNTIQTASQSSRIWWQAPNILEENKTTAITKHPAIPEIINRYILKEKSGGWGRSRELKEKGEPPFLLIIGRTNISWRMETTSNKSREKDSRSQGTIGSSCA